MIIVLSGQADWTLAQDADRAAVEAARPVREVMDFLNERLPIPDSQRYRHADFTDTGVGLSFGVDKRLSYDTRNYQEAVQQFEEAVARYPYKAEIWVYLARAYYHGGEPAQAREALDRASGLMPDLQHRVWDPLLESMLGEVRRRAAHARTEIDFYTKNRDDFRSLFSVHTFLEDNDGAKGIVNAAMERSRELRARAQMAAAGTARRYMDEATAWLALAEQLRGELRDLGADVDAVPDTDGLEESEGGGLPLAVRRLQLMVDYYSVTPDDYRELYETYRELDRPNLAAGVLMLLRRAILRLELQEDLATNPHDGASLSRRKTVLQELHDQLQAIADADDASD